MNMNRNFYTQLERGLERRLTKSMVKVYWALMHMELVTTSNMQGYLFLHIKAKSVSILGTVCRENTGPAQTGNG